MSNPYLDQWRPVIDEIRQKATDFTPEQLKLHDFLETADLLNDYDNYQHKERVWGDLSVPEKKAACTRQTGRVMTAKLPNGQVDTRPIYCNLCERCYKANALKLKSRIDSFQEIANEQEVPGQWRKKTVADKTEAQSLKKRISRNQGGRYFEVACTSKTNDIYIYVENEEGKDMDKIYGEAVSLDNIDYDAMYKANRSTGKKMSTGKAFRGGTTPGKENTIRVIVPHFILDDNTGQAENIIRTTNYLELADTPEKAKQLYDFQLKYIIKELKEAGIKILAIEPKYHNFEGAQLLDDWNRNVKYWMSINAPLHEKNEVNMDTLTSRLHQKVFGTPEVLAN